MSCGSRILLAFARQQRRAHPAITRARLSCHPSANLKARVHLSTGRQCADLFRIPSRRAIDRRIAVCRAYQLAFRLGIGVWRLWRWQRRLKRSKRLRGVSRAYTVCTSRRQNDRDTCDHCFEAIHRRFSFFVVPIFFIEPRLKS